MRCAKDGGLRWPVSPWVSLRTKAARPGVCERPAASRSGFGNHPGEAREGTEAEPEQQAVALLQWLSWLWVAPACSVAPHPFLQGPSPALPGGQLSYKEGGNDPWTALHGSGWSRARFAATEPDASKNLNFSLRVFCGAGKKAKYSLPPHRHPDAPSSSRPLPCSGFQPPAEPSPQDRRPRPTLVRARRGPLPAPPVHPPRRAAPWLTADHPAAENSVAAEQRGAQQQPEHAAHRGAATAAGVACSEDGLCPPRSRRSNLGASQPPRRALLPPSQPRRPAACTHRLRRGLQPGALGRRAGVTG